MLKSFKLLDGRRAAFTLVELLVVISIILIASSIIFISGSGGDGAKLSSSQRIVSGIAQGARGQAILKNAETRLIVYSETNSDGELDKWLRFFGIVYWGTDENGVEGWLPATQGTYLPEGIYLNPDLSDNSPSSWSAPTMTLDYPRRTAGNNTDRLNGGGGETYYYYSFKSNGTMGTNFQNSWLVMQAGTLKPGAGDSFTVDFSEPDKANLKAALIFRRVGTTSVVDDPSDIN
ncbi:MAG: prepilin-type N-terminal cleavage/methylation domain-containing protein [Verrucomicrobiota bacterium]